MLGGKCAALAICGLILSAWCAVASAAPEQARITTVSFTGSVANPTVTVVGSGLGSPPRPSPSFPPAPPKGAAPPYGCTTAGGVGYDYGTRLWLADPAQGRVWSAGRYRPALKELDCVGLVLRSYTATKVVYRLGADYRVHRYELAEGDPYQISVNGAVKRGIVHYTAR